MTVYELIQELAEFDANTLVEFEVKFDTNEVLELCEDNKQCGIEESIMQGEMDGIARGSRSAIINIDAY